MIKIKAILTFIVSNLRYRFGDSFPILGIVAGSLLTFLAVEGHRLASSRFLNGRLANQSLLGDLVLLTKPSDPELTVDLSKPNIDEGLYAEVEEVVKEFGFVKHMLPFTRKHVGISNGCKVVPGNFMVFSRRFNYSLPGAELQGPYCQLFKGGCDGLFDEFDSNSLAPLVLTRSMADILGKNKIYPQVERDQVVRYVDCESSEKSELIARDADLQVYFLTEGDQNIENQHLMDGSILTLANAGNAFTESFTGFANSEALLAGAGGAKFSAMSIFIDGSKPLGKAQSLLSSAFAKKFADKFILIKPTDKVIDPISWGMLMWFDFVFWFFVVTTVPLILIVIRQFQAVSFMERRQEHAILQSLGYEISFLRLLSFIEIATGAILGCLICYPLSKVVFFAVNRAGFHYFGPALSDPVRFQLLFDLRIYIIYSVTIVGVVLLGTLVSQRRRFWV